MTSMATNRLHGCNATDKWPIRNTSGRRKTLINTSTPLDENWSQDVNSNALRYTASNVYHDYDSEHNVKFPDPKTSEETVVDQDETNINKNNLHAHASGVSHVDTIPKHKEETILRRKNPDANDYERIDMPEAMMALQKLQKLKELQRRRDLTEKYYTQEIRRLIGEHYFNPRVTVPSWKFDERMRGLQSFSGDRLKNSLESCGTMTTITRLDCGCIQETTRPIFTTAKGRVQKKACSQSKDEVLLRLTSSNPPEHLYSSIEPQKGRSCTAKPKKRFTLDPRTYTKMSTSLNRDLEITSNQRSDAQKPEPLDRLSRNVSPVRKLSDTSTTSV